MEDNNRGLDAAMDVIAQEMKEMTINSGETTEKSEEKRELSMANDRSRGLGKPENETSRRHALIHEGRMEQREGEDRREARPDREDSL